MQDLPHVYQVSGVAAKEGEVTLSAANLPDVISAPPAEFGGPGNLWSPESLLVAAVADCFVLTFRAIAGASKLEWSNLDCSAEGTLDREDRVTGQGAALARKSRERLSHYQFVIGRMSS
jgi:organic hydroperoxide reductase OsmC/OhrA